MAVGLCGSRKASDRGLEVAADWARQLSEAGIVVSGYGISRGRAQKWGAYDHCAPRGHQSFSHQEDREISLDWERILVVSQFPRDAIWRADRAMERNKVIVALSRAVIVLEAREQGGTLNAGSALQLGKPLFVALYDDMNGSRDDNQRLIQEGGKPLLRNRATSQAQMQEVFANVGLAN
jgi:DNA processing protein